MILLVLTMAYRATSIMLQTTIPLFAKYVLHSSDFLVSLIVAMSSIFPILSLGYITVKGISVSNGLLLSLVGISAALPVYLFISNPLMLAVVSSFVYFWTAPASVLLLASVILTSPGEKRERNVILFTAALSASLVLSPAFQGFVLSLSSDNLALSMALFAPILVVSLVFFSLIRHDAELTIRSRFDLGFLRNRNYVLGVLSNEIFSVPFALLLTFGGIFSKNELGASYVTIETLFALFFVTSFIVRIFLSRIRASKYYLVITVSATTIVGLALIYDSSSLGELALSFALLGYAHGLYFPTSSNYIADAASRQKFTTANSVSTVIDQIVTSASLPIMGAIVGTFGLRSVFLYVEAPVLVLSLVFLKLGRRRDSSNLDSIGKFA